MAKHLLLMPNNELLVIQKIMWEVVGCQQAHGEFDFQTIELSMQKQIQDKKIKSDNVDVID